jgi:hypothetical protein
MGSLPTGFLRPMSTSPFVMYVLGSVLSTAGQGRSVYAELENLPVLAAMDLTWEKKIL